MGTLAVSRRPRVIFKPGDLVEYVPNEGMYSTGHSGLGIVVQVDLNSHPMAEVMWACFPEQGPVWFNIANLRMIRGTQDDENL